MRTLTREEFGRLFDTCRDGFRLETLQSYDVSEEAEDLRAWREGRQFPPDPWAQFISRRVAEGSTWRRVHVIREPIGPYLRYEFERYRGSVEAGEGVRIAVLNEYPELAELTRDWWGFDLDSDWPVLALMRYDDAGRWHGADGTSEPLIVARYRQERDLALACSMPLHEYLASAGG